MELGRTGAKNGDIHQDIKTQLFIGLYGLKDGGDFHHDKIQGVTVFFNQLKDRAG